MTLDLEDGQTALETLLTRKIGTAGARRKEIPDEFLRIKRGLDLYWQTFVGDMPVLVVLMPFASDSAKDGFLLRVDNWLQSRYEGDFESLKIRLSVINFAAPDPLTALATAVENT